MRFLALRKTILRWYLKQKRTPRSHKRDSKELTAFYTSALRFQDVLLTLSGRWLTIFRNTTAYGAKNVRLKRFRFKNYRGIEVLKTFFPLRWNEVQQDYGNKTIFLEVDILFGDLRDNITSNTFGEWTKRL